MILDKSKLIEEGFLNFNLKELDIELYNNLYKTFNKKDALENISNLKYNGKINLNNKDYILNDPDKFFSELILEYNLNSFSKFEYDICDETFNTKKSLSFRPNLSGKFENLCKLKKRLDDLCEARSQTWYFTSFINNIENLNLVKTIHKKIVNELYPIEASSLYTNSNREAIDLTLYLKDDFIENHSDGIDIGRYCVILIYLNDDYQEGYGGELVINDYNIVRPEFGNISILDFTKNNVKHRVNAVLDDNFKRFAYIKFFYE